MQREAEQETRKCLSTVENMPFLDIEDALFEARRASSLRQYVTY